MIPLYLDMYIEKEPLSLVFKVPRRLVEFYQSLDDEILLNLAHKTLATHYFFARLRQADDAPKDQGMFDDYFRSLEIQKIRGLFGEYFGCGQTVAIKKKGDDFYYFEAVIPKSLLLTDEVCSFCHGSKTNQNESEIYGREIPCNSCAGTGLKVINQGRLAKELADNICLLFRLVSSLLQCCPEPINSKYPMLMFLVTGVEGYGQQFIGGYYTQVFKDYLHNILVSQTEEKIKEEVSNQMMTAYNLMWAGENKNSYREFFEFRTEIYWRKDSLEKRTPFFSVEVPGVNGCHVYSEQGGFIYPAPPNYRGGAFSLAQHNIDNSNQQLALIVGLAHLCGLARQWFEDNRA